MSDQHIEVARSDDITIARIIDRSIVDEVDIHELGQELFRLVEVEKPSQLILNFARVGFLSSAALGRLLVLHRTARQHETRMILTELQPAIHEVLAVTRLNELFEIKDTDGDAIQSLRG